MTSKKLFRWKLWGFLTITTLTASHIFGRYSVAKIIGDYSLLGLALSYAGFFLFWLFILGFLYSWRLRRINFPKFLNRKGALSSIPIILITYMELSLFLYEEFVAFQVLPSPLLIIDIPLVFLVMFATTPFDPLLRPLGLWASSGLGVLSGPSTLGSYVIAGIYSIGIYLLWSGVSRLTGRTNQTRGPR